jgi:hypothetical protein
MNILGAHFFIFIHMCTMFWEKSLFDSLHTYTVHLGMLLSLYDMHLALA